MYEMFAILMAVFFMYMYNISIIIYKSEGFSNSILYSVRQKYKNQLATIQHKHCLCSHIAYIKPLWYLFVIRENIVPFYVDSILVIDLPFQGSIGWFYFW